MGSAREKQQVIPAACPLNCWDGCSFCVTITGDTVTRLAGNPHHPYCDKFICQRGKRLKDILYHPERLLSPLRKTETGFKKISWDEAFDLIAERLEQARQTSTLSVAHYYDYGNGGALKDLEHRFFNALGGVTVPEGDLCFHNGLTAQKLDFGANRAHPPEDILNARTVIIWGRNPYYTNVHLVPLLRQARSQGTRVIVIDPIPTPTAENADIHIRPRAGTDLALALALGYVIITEGLVDRDFITKKTRSFEAYRELALKYPPEKASSLSGVPVGEIINLAHRYAEEGPSTILLGWGMSRHSSAVSTIRAVDALAALTGNLGIPGGGVNFANRINADSFADITGPELAQARRLFPKADFGAALLEARDPGIETLFVTRSNPAVQLPGSRSFIQAMQRIPFTVVIDFFMTPTAEYADLVLPAAMALEDYDDVVVCSWHDYILYLPKVTEPRGEAKSEFDIYRELAQRLGLESFYGTPDYWLKELLGPLIEAGLDLEMLKSRGIARNPLSPRIPFADKFATKSGRFEFLKEADLKREQVSFPDRGGEYSLHLLTPTPREFLHSQGNRVFNRELPSFEISPETARDFGISEGDKIRVITPGGSISGTAAIREGLERNTVVCYHGWWSKTEGSINFLTPTTFSPLGKGSALADCRCRVEKIEDGEQQ